MNAFDTYDKKAVSKHFSDAVSMAYRANHVPQAQDAYGELQDFIEEYEIVLEDMDPGPDKLHLKTRLKSAKGEQNMLIQKFGPLIADDYR